MKQFSTNTKNKKLVQQILAGWGHEFILNKARAGHFGFGLRDRVFDFYYSNY